MTRAQTIVERLLARKPSVNEGLEGKLEKYLDTLGFINGHDFYFENGLHINNPDLVDTIVSAINNAGQFGSASAEDGLVSFQPIGQAGQAVDTAMDTAVDMGDYGEGGELSFHDREARMLRHGVEAPQSDVDPETLVMCDNCGSQTHHTEDCHFSQGVNLRR